MYFNRPLLYLSLFLLTLIGCKTDEGKTTSTDNPTLDKSYINFTTGKYIDYQLDSAIYYNDGATIIESTNIIREEIGRKFIDDAGNESYEILRYIYQADINQWSLTDVWAYKITSRSIDKIEENLRTINIAYPINPLSLWDGTSYIETTQKIPYTDRVAEIIQKYKGWNFFYENINKTFKVDETTYDNTITVIQVDNENEKNKIERRYSKEVYAKNIGLIYKTQMILDTQCSQSEYLTNGQPDFLK